MLGSDLITWNHCKGTSGDKQVLVLFWLNFQQPELNVKPQQLQAERASAQHRVVKQVEIQ